MTLTVYAPNGANVITFRDIDDGTTDGNIHMDIVPNQSYVDQVYEFLMYSFIKLNKKIVYLFIIFLILMLLTPTVYATNYTVRPSINEEPGISATGEKIQALEPAPYWLYLLSWVLPHAVATLTEAVLSIKIFLYLIHKKIEKWGVLDNNTRLKLYEFIEKHPGVYFRQLVKRTEMNKGTVEYHLKKLKAQNKIISYNGDGKLRFFLNRNTYGKDEQIVIAALGNDMRRKILIGILSNQYINNKTLAENIGVSASTISYHISHLKKEGIVKSDENGKYKNYSIGSGYLDSLTKYMDSTGH